MEELKPCPFCGELPQVADGTAMHACRVRDREMRVPVAAWNSRTERDGSVTSGQRDKLLAIADDLAMAYEVRCGLLMTGSSGNILCGEQLARSMRDYEIACRIRKALGVKDDAMEDVLWES